MNKDPNCPNCRGKASYKCLLCEKPNQQYHEVYARKYLASYTQWVVHNLIGLTA